MAKPTKIQPQKATATAATAKKMTSICSMKEENFEKFQDEAEGGYLQSYCMAC